MSCPANEIIPGLFLGSRHMITEHTDWLAVNRIDVVISVLSEEEYADFMIGAPDFEGRTWYRLVADDEPTEELYLHFNNVHAIIRRALSEGRRVLVHCAAGVSRSATLVAAYLIAERTMRVRDAITYIATRREFINPNPGFRKQLGLFHRICGIDA